MSGFAEIQFLGQRTICYFAGIQFLGQQTHEVPARGRPTHGADAATARRKPGPHLAATRGQPYKDHWPLTYILVWPLTYILV